LVTKVLKAGTRRPTGEERERAREREIKTA